jgi:xylulokinase
VSDRLVYDPASRVNSFAHVNYREEEKRIGVLLCINGTGILNRWIRDHVGGGADYVSLNKEAALIRPGSEGLVVLPFGNGAERIFRNRIIGAHLQHIDLNQHGAAHIYRAGQEGIAFAFRYGLDIMREGGMHPSVIRAGRANMFLSSVFMEAFVNATQVPVELYDNDGSVGAALGAGVGAGIFRSGKEAFAGRKPLKRVEPEKTAEYDVLYERWKKILHNYQESLEGARPKDRH